MRDAVALLAAALIGVVTGLGGPTRVPVDIVTEVAITRGPADAPFPPNASSAYVAITRMGGYALRLPQKAPSSLPALRGHFNPALYVVPVHTLSTTTITAFLPRVATTGNTTLCLSDADGKCLQGFVPWFFEHYFTFAPAFTRRPYLEESEGGLIADVDSSVLKHNPLPRVEVAIVFAGENVQTISGALDMGPLKPDGFATGLFSFSLESLPGSVDCDANITIVAHSGSAVVATTTFTRRFLRAPPPPPGRGTTMWQVDHERMGLRADGRRFFASGWFDAGFTRVSAGVPPNVLVPTLPPGKIDALNQASMLAEWGRQGVTFVRAGGPFITQAANYSEAVAKEYLDDFMTVLDAAHAAGIYLLVNSGAQAWANAISGIGVNSVPWSTAEDWKRWTLGNISIIKDHPAVGGWYGCDDCCHPGVVREYGPVQYYALAQIHQMIRQVDPYHLMWGTVACRAMWMWQDSYGSSGLGLDVPMAEAYGGGMDTFSNLRTFPMNFEPMANMPDPSKFAPYTLRSHSYSSVVGGKLMMNAFDMTIHQFPHFATNAEVGWWSAEAGNTLLPAILSSADVVDNAATMTVVHVEENRTLNSILLREEVPPNIRSPEHAYCYTAIIVNGKNIPGRINGQLEGVTLPPSDSILPLRRILGADYEVNLTLQHSGNWTFTDFIDSLTTNIYNLGCDLDDGGCTTIQEQRPGHPLPTSTCLVNNGGFEYTALTPGFNNGLAQPGSLGDLGSGWLPTVSMDDRVRIQTDTADPHAGRHSLRVHIPTREGLWMPLNLNAKAPGPLVVGLKYTLGVWARSAPAGATLYMYVGAQVPTLDPPVGTVKLGILTRDWTYFESNFTQQNATSPKAAVSDGVADSSSELEEEVVQGARFKGGPQFLIVPAAIEPAMAGGGKNLGGKVWLDDVSILSQTSSQPRFSAISRSLAP